MRPTSYKIVDNHTGRVVAETKTRRGATLAVDRRDNAYGGYRYTARPVWPDSPAS